MDLYIDTGDKKIVRLSLRQGKLILAEKNFVAEHKQAEKLLPAIKQLLENIKAGAKEIKKIYVVRHGWSFTALRIGVVTANALGFALGAEVLPLGRESKKKKKRKISIIKPIYHKEPNITGQNSKTLF